MNKFARGVLNLLGDEWSATRGCFYKRPIVNIACGFLLENTPNSQFIWRFCLPICDHILHFYLPFSERLPGTEGYIARKDRAPLSPAEFVERVQPHVQRALQFADLEFFTRQFADSLNISSPIARRTYSTVLIMGGHLDQARVELQKCLSDISNEGDGFRADTADLLNALERA